MVVGLKWTSSKKEWAAEKWLNRPVAVGPAQFGYLDTVAGQIGYWERGVYPIGDSSGENVEAGTIQNPIRKEPTPTGSDRYRHQTTPTRNHRHQTTPIGL